MPIDPPSPDRKPRSKNSTGLQSLVEAEKLMQIALVLPSGVVIGWLAGAWLDSRLHQTWIVMVGIVLGSIAGLVSAIRMALAAGAGPKSESTNRSGKESSGKQP
jgi:F0F1-type ATP synthase assembly protein I